MRDFHCLLLASLALAGKRFFVFALWLSTRKSSLGLSVAISTREGDALMSSSVCHYQGYSNRICAAYILTFELAITGGRWLYSTIIGDTLDVPFCRAFPLAFSG